MFEMKANPLKNGPKFVFLVPCLVLFAACSSKQIKNASMEPLDLPAEESSASYATLEPEIAAPAVPATVRKTAKKAKKHKARKSGKLAARGSLRKKQAARKPAPQVAAAATIAQELPVIGESTLASAPIEMPPIAPPIPPAEIEAQTQPNWWLTAFIVAGVVALGGVALRMRRQVGRKRGLIYN